MDLHDPTPPLQILDPEALLGRLASGETMVTANNRLARILSDEYAGWRLASGDSQWPSPDILSWDAWLDRLWQAAGLAGIEACGRAVPGKRQLGSLWAAVLRSDPLAGRVLKTEGLAGHLADTRRLAVDWRIDLRHSAWSGSGNENHEAFRRWNRSFEALCEQEGWIPPEDRAGVLADAISGSWAHGPVSIGLLGFDEINPGQLELLRALVDSGSRIACLAPAPKSDRASVWRSGSDPEELDAMARWARHWLESEAGSRIAVVVPDLQRRREDVERHLAAVLTPEGQEDDGLGRPWNISLGVPLARVPMVETAFDLFDALGRSIDIQLIGRILRSPWIRGGLAERNQRSLLEKCLRAYYPRALTLEQVRFRAAEFRAPEERGGEQTSDRREPRAWNCPIMTAIVATLREFRRSERTPRPPSAWAQCIDQLLARVGWPLAGGPEEETTALENRHDWQAYQAWQDALRELASLDATHSEMSREEALATLRQICRDRLFQARTEAASLQVLGLYEASGLQFDHLWVLGLHDDNWPPPARPNPFIPGRLQQAAGMPHCSPQRELEVADRVTRRLVLSADEVVFSYPASAAGEPLLPSPLLRGGPFSRVETVPGWRGERWLDAVASAPAPRVERLDMPEPLSRDTARGGSSILRHQALCPFRAFASNRLGADGFESPTEGVSPWLHGQLLHQVLERFWRETGNQASLAALSEKQLGERIRGHVAEVIGEEHSLRFRHALRKVESDRLARQAAAFLELEKRRQAFEVIGFEREVISEIEGQAIRLFIDRIDRLETGEELIIDYKTGRVDPKKWFGDRPEDPQLPLYAISAEQMPAAVVFAVVREDGCHYSGVVRQPELFPGLPPRQAKSTEQLLAAGNDMPATIAGWRGTLHRLMSAFLDGVAPIDPRDGARTCENSYCELQSLCRIRELERLGESGGGDPSGTAP
jgi:probable DNA repair protein